MVGGSTAAIFQAITLGTWFSKTGRQKLGVLAHKPNQDLAFMVELFEAGKVVPMIDRRYSLPEVPEAFRYFSEGHAKGKVVVTLEQNNRA